MNKKILLGVVSVLILLIIVYITKSIKPAPVAEQQAIEQNEILLPPEPGTETPASEQDVTGQPANLVNAYSKNGKNYLDVDYVDWLHGEASLKAQKEDGVCTSIGTDDCYDYPNGYHRNRNPKIRTFEISEPAPIMLGGTNMIYWLFIYEVISDTDFDNLTKARELGQANISFNQLKELVSRIKVELPETELFITIDVRDGLITKIFEPYQE